MKHCFIFLTIRIMIRITIINVSRKLCNCLKETYQKHLSLKAIMRQLGCINSAKLFYVMKQEARRKIYYVQLCTFSFK